MDQRTLIESVKANLSMRILIKLLYYGVFAGIYLYWNVRLPKAHYLTHFGYTLLTGLAILGIVCIVLSCVFTVRFFVQTRQVAEGKCETVDLPRR